MTSLRLGRVMEKVMLKDIIIRFVEEFIFMNVVYPWT